MDRLPLDRRALGALGLVLLLALLDVAVLRAKLRAVDAVRTELASLAGRPPALAAVTPITETERRLWSELERRLGRRFPSEADLPKAMAEVAELGRRAGLDVTGLEIEVPKAGPRAGPPPPPPPPLPPGLRPNPATIRLTAEHRYAGLVHFLAALEGAPVYLRVQSLQVTRVEDRLRTELVLGSATWGK